MSQVLSKMTVRNSGIVGVSLILAYWMSRASLKLREKRKEPVDEISCAYNQKEKKKEKAQVDRTFIRQLFRILRILIPGVFTAESAYLVLVALTLIGRTLCDIWLIQNNTIMERAIITRNSNMFLKNLESYIFAMPLVSLINSLLKFGLHEMKLKFRSRLASHLYDRYLHGITYYQMNNLDNRISNPDQLLTQDVDKFCSSLAELYSNICKPILDIIIFAEGLTASIGAQVPSLMMMYLIFIGSLLTRLRSPTARMTANEQKLEGELRYVNSRLIMNSEEVAFYHGNEREKRTIKQALKRLVSHLRTSHYFQFFMGYIENIAAKYWATAFGFFIISRPFLGNRHSEMTHNNRLELYYRSGRMLVKLAEAVGRLVLASNELTRLAGFTLRISQLMRVLDDLNKGQYERTMVDSWQNNNTSDRINSMQLMSGNGKIITEDNIIKFIKVPLMTPNGDVLIEELSFEVQSGMNVIVCGPNGCGKSSLFRILGELWPVFGGTVIKPAKLNLFYIPQKPYMTLGTLRDQVIYPDSYENMMKKNITDNDLKYYLELVQLTYLLDREGGWDAIQDWLDVLSGGEKQRIAMARLFYCKPQFAILDECTSAVSVDVEGSMYQYCKKVGITLFTVSHRKSLWKYHDYFLYMDGRGGYEYKEIGPDTEEFGS